MRLFSSLRKRSHAEKKFLPRSNRPIAAGPLPKPAENESLSIFVIAFIVNLSVSILFNFFWIIGESEALLTTSIGQLILTGGTSDVGSIALVKPPLTSLLQIVFLPLLNLFDIAFFSGPLLSCIFGALTLLFLNLILLQFNIPKLFRWALLGLTLLYPGYLYTSVTGSAEALYLFIVIFVVWGALQISRNNLSFLICGFGLAVGFYIKYEVIALVVSVVLALIICKWNIHEDWQTELEGQLLAFITPVIYAMALWIIFSWFSVSDPFHFLRRLFLPAYVLAGARNAGILHPLTLGWGNLFEASWIGIQYIWQSAPLFVIAIIFGIYMAFSSKRRDYVSILLIMLSVPGMNILKILLGVQPPWLYPWTFGVLFTIILAGMVFRDIRPPKGNVLLVAAILLTAASMILTFSAMGNHGRSRGEQRFHALLMGHSDHEKALRDTDPYWIFRHDIPIITEKLDTLPKDAMILVNASYAYPINLFTGYTDRLMIVDEIDNQTLINFSGSGAGYILILAEQVSINESYAPLADPVLPDVVTADTALIWSPNQTILDWQIYQISAD